MARLTPWLVVCGLALVLLGPAEAEDAASGVILESTRVATLSSSFADQDYKIHIALPYSHGSSELTHPVVDLLDSDVLFGLVTDVSRLLPLEGVPAFLGQQRVPELIVVKPQSSRAPVPRMRMMR